MHLILFTHGSRDPRWLESFKRLFEETKKKAPKDNISLAFLEFASPSLTEAIARSYAAGERSFKILPLFLASGAHLAEDLPQDLAEIKRNLPEAEIKVLPALGEHPRLRELMVEVIVNNSLA